MGSSQHTGQVTVFYNNTSNNKVTLTATVYPSDATDKRITWSQANINSANNVAATLSSTTANSITVTAGSSGRAQRKITVTTTNGSKTADITMIACEDVTNYTAKIVSGGADFYKGPSTSSYGTRLTTIPANTTVTISARYGTDWLYLQNPNQSGQWGYIQTSKLQVPVTGITVSPNTVAGFTTRCIYVGESKDVTVTVSPSNATNKNYNWSFSPTGIATANSNSPTIRATKEGTATATVSAASDSSKSAAVKVVVITKLVKSVKGWMTAAQYLWDGPGTSFTRLSTSLSVNQEITVLGMCGNFYYVQTGAGNVGFVSMTNVFAYEKRGLELNLSQSNKNAGTKVVGKDGAAYYDYTVPVNKRLVEEVPEFKKVGHWGNMIWFYGQVKGGGPWDIKLKDSWEIQFGTLRFPAYKGESLGGENEKFIYRNIIVDKAYLGNITYGYLGTASGYIPSVLRLGSNFAAGFKDDPEDIPQIQKGIDFYNADYP
jgi:uncharacterized protein YjdB